MLKKKKKNPDQSESDSSEVDEYEYGYPSHVQQMMGAPPKTSSNLSAQILSESV